MTTSLVSMLAEMNYVHSHVYIRDPALSLLNSRCIVTRCAYCRIRLNASSLESPQPKSNLLSSRTVNYESPRKAQSWDHVNPTASTSVPGTPSDKPRANGTRSTHRQKLGLVSTRMSCPDTRKLLIQKHGRTWDHRDSRVAECRTVRVDFPFFSRRRVGPRDEV